MPEPLLHFTIAFASSKLAGLDDERSLLIAFFSLVPDLDVFFHVHRSLTHSLVPWLLIALPVILIPKRENRIRLLFILLLVGVSLHIFLDMFCGYTPFLWPIYGKAISIRVSFNVRIASPMSFRTGISLDETPVVFTYIDKIDAPLMTERGVAVSLALFVPYTLRRILKASSLRA
ncbi:MAG: metal-dependent hydrolase [Thermoprotei archaeon]|nr:metal-dependent hydrolase [Thermoprotei archaeon]